MYCTIIAPNEHRISVVIILFHPARPHMATLGASPPPRATRGATAARASTASRGDSNRAALRRARVVLWDVDGTLADSTELGFSSTNKVLRDAALREITRDEYLRGTRYTTPRRLAWHATKNADDACGEALGAAFDDAYVALVTTTTAGFYPGIARIVVRLREEGRKQAVLSNACGAYARAVIAANECVDVMARVYGADDVPRAKPEPDGLVQIARELGLECIDRSMAYVGDAPSDGAAAKSAGMLAVGVNWGSHDLREEANARNFHVVFDTVEELAASLFDD
jgi:phosphoglycolate phosphatase-like HAD superfamily hydrolase